MKVDDANFAGADIRRADVHDVDCKLEIILANPLTKLPTQPMSLQY